MIFTPAFAATAEHAAEHHSLFQDPTFWVGIAFFITVLALVKLAGKAIGGILQKRADSIEHKLNEAAALRKQTGELLAQYRKQLAASEQTARDAVTQANEDAKKLKATLIAECEEKLKRREVDTRRRLDRAAEEAGAEIRALAVEIATRATQKLLTEKLSDETEQRLIDEAIDALPALFAQKHIA